jgi:hypothetical protein
MAAGLSAFADTHGRVALPCLAAWAGDGRSSPTENAMTTPPKPSQADHREEPEITQEEAVPTDGKDVEGEEMMKQVRNRKLEEQPGEEKSED